jgi:hypothetical protein
MRPRARSANCAKRDHTTYRRLVASSSPLLISPSMAEDLARVEAELRGSVQTEDPFLTEVASHLILAGGKRIRPGFTIASAFGALAEAGPAAHDVIMGAVSGSSCTSARSITTTSWTTRPRDARSTASTPAGAT